MMEDLSFLEQVLTSFLKNLQLMASLGYLMGMLESVVRLDRIVPWDYHLVSDQLEQSINYLATKDDEVCN